MSTEASERSTGTAVHLKMPTTVVIIIMILQNRDAPAPPANPPRTPNDGAPKEAEAWRQTRLAVSDDEEE